MAVIIPPGFIQVQYLFRTGGGGKNCTNTVGYSVTAGLTQANVDTIATTIAPYYTAILNNAGAFNGVKVIVGNDGPETEFVSTGASVAGARSVTLAAPQIQYVISKTTALRGRKYRGRVFVGDVSETNVDNFGSLVTAEQTLVNNLASHLNSALGLGSIIGTTVILHGDSTVPTPVSGMACEAKVGTLRRRYTR
jgi:hypothetical protein